MSERLRRPRLVGRTPQLALLGALLVTVSSGVSSAVTIGGDAGRGRTRLLHEFLATVPGDALVLLGACLGGSERPVPFAPLLEALRSPVAAAGQR